jgi:hypothetical protein
MGKKAKKRFRQQYGHGPYGPYGYGPYGAPPPYGPWPQAGFDPETGLPLGDYPGMGHGHDFGHGAHGFGPAGYNPDFLRGMSTFLPPHHTEQFLMGLLVGAGAAWVLNDEELRGKLIKAGMKLYANVAGGFEELKEQMADLKAEVAAERHGDE